MIITCEECSTRFNLDDTLIQPEGTKVRCSQCKHVFTAFPEPAQPSETPEPAPAPGDADAPDDIDFDDSNPSSQAADDDFDDIPFDEPETSEQAEPEVPATDDTEDEDLAFDFDEDDFDQDMDLGLDEEIEEDQDEALDFPEEPGIEEPSLEMETAEPEETDALEESGDMDFEFEETDISFDEDAIEFEDDDLGFEDTLKAIDDLESGGSETDEIEDDGTDSLEVDTMETVDTEADTGLDNLEMEIDTPQDKEIEIPDSGLEMEDTGPEPDEIQFDEPGDIEFDEPELDDIGFEETGDIEFDEPELEEADTEFPDLEFEESTPDEDDETADIEISFDDEDDSQELADLPLEMEPAEELEFEASDIPTDVVGDEDEQLLGEIDFQGLESDDEETTPDLDLSFEEDPDADLVFEESSDEQDPMAGLDLAMETDEDEAPSFPELDEFNAEDGPETEEDGIDLSFDEADIEAPDPLAVPFEEDNTEFQASLDAELEDDKFSGYDQVLDQEVEPEQDLPDFDRELKPDQDQAGPPPLPPELPPAVDETAPAPESRPQESPLIEPPPEDDVRKRRTRQKKAAIGAPIKVIFLLFLLVIAAYAVSLRFGYTIPFLSDIKVPYLTQALKPEPPPKPVVKPIPNEASINGRFVSNGTAGELFIVTGKVENPSDMAYSYIRVKGTLITKDKKKATTQIIYCGNIISEEDLKSGNISDINKQLTVKQGLENTNENIHPGKSVRFMLVFSDLPENLANFTVEVMDFQPGAGKK
jgi:predicted Zn finger-like uncharacterized protein